MIRYYFKLLSPSEEITLLTEEVYYVAIKYAIEIRFKDFKNECNDANAPKRPQRLININFI